MILLLIYALSLINCPQVKIMTPPMYKTDSTITAMLHIDGGAEPFTYFWGNETTRDYCVLPKVAQTITVTVTDHNGCIVRDTLVIIQ
jgi:hypothetical protein